MADFAKVDPKTLKIGDTFTHDEGQFGYIYEVIGFAKEGEITEYWPAYPIPIDCIISINKETDDIGRSYMTRPDFYLVEKKVAEDDFWWQDEDQKGPLAQALRDMEKL